MAKVSVLDMTGKVVGDMELSDQVFGVEVNEHLVHLAVVQQLANNRQGTQSAKTRNEVSGGGKKPWRQKGTGHARQGSIRAAQWKGGGIIFAPKPRDYSFKMNRKEKQAALKSALTAKVAGEKFVVIDKIALPEIKTKAMASFLSAVKAEKALVILSSVDDTVIASARNIPTVKTTQVGTLNVYDLLKYETVVADQDAVKAIEEVYA
ncbi:MAG: 50S ribosomal protein L4 [Lachnospiraceae bacterium]|nr:50S ribosomal protein L4 [Lachnospiraceae bacterium]